MNHSRNPQPVHQHASGSVSTPRPARDRNALLSDSWVSTEQYNAALARYLQLRQSLMGL
jgi:hypothetical protein